MSHYCNLHIAVALSFHDEEDLDVNDLETTISSPPRAETLKSRTPIVGLASPPPDEYTPLPAARMVRTFRI